MAKAAKGGGDSKQGLIITLVFFVLLSIGLGVGTYYGFAGQKELDDKAKKAAQEQKSAQADRDWYKFQALMARSYIGGPLTKNEEADLPVLRQSMDSGSLGKESGGVDEVAKMIRALDGRPELAWDPTTRKVRGNLIGLLGTRETELANLATARAALDAQFKQAQDEAARRRDADQKQLAAYKQHNDALEAKLNEYEKSKSQEFVALANKNEELQKAVEDQTKRINNAKEDLEKKDKDLRDKLREKDEKYQKLVADTAKEEDVMAHETPRGKILNLDRRGEYAFINLGSYDHVKPQLTFSIFAQNPAGKAQGKTRKARLEVVDVLDSHLSRGRIVNVTDPNRDPVVSGDLLFNPAWSPNLKQHIAIAGLIDLTGDGSDSSEEFIRNLQKQNIVIDAYLDLKTLELKGKLGFNTSYLVRGDIPELDLGNPLKENDPRSTRIRDVQVKLSEIQSEAQKFGITVVPARKFMSMIGYEVPKNIVPPDYTIRGQRSTAPAEKKPELEPAKKDEPKDDKEAPKGKEKGR